MPLNFLFLQRQPDAPLPLLQFKPGAPDYFDRDTISVKKSRLSMYALEARMHLQPGIQSQHKERFFQEKLRDVVSSRTAQGFRLSILFSSTTSEGQEKTEVVNEKPEYVLVLPPRSAAARATEPHLAEKA